MTILYFLLFFTLYAQASFDKRSYPLNDDQKKRIVGFKTVKSRDAKTITTLLGPNDYGYAIPSNTQIIGVRVTGQELLQEGYKITIREHVMYNDGDTASFSQEKNINDSCTIS